MPRRPDKDEEQRLLAVAFKWEQMYRGHLVTAEGARESRNAAVCRAVGRGVPASVIARRLGLSSQRVLQIKKAKP